MVIYKIAAVEYLIQYSLKMKTKSNVAILFCFVLLLIIICEEKVCNVNIKLAPAKPCSCYSHKS